jgi:hypothetical protein
MLRGFFNVTREFSTYCGIPTIGYGKVISISGWKKLPSCRGRKASCGDQRMAKRVNSSWYKIVAKKFSSGLESLPAGRPTGHFLYEEIGQGVRAAPSPVRRPIGILGLAHPRHKSAYLINSSMAEEQQACPIEVPAVLGQLIAVNAEFKVLCISPAGAVEHLRKIHKEKPPVRNQVQEYVTEIP